MLSMAYEIFKIADKADFLKLSLDECPTIELVLLFLKH